MRKDAYSHSEGSRSDTPTGGDIAAIRAGLPNKLLTAFEVAEFVGCHEETVRRAYLRGLLTSQLRRQKPALPSG